jgi:hypothetical protein
MFIHLYEKNVRIINLKKKLKKIDILFSFNFNKQVI